MRVGPSFVGVNWKQALAELLVRQGFNGVDAGGAESRDCCAERGADEGQADGADDPTRSEQDGKRGIRLLQDGFGEKCDANAEDAAGDGEKGGFAEKHFDYVESGKAERLEDADFAGAFQNHRVHVHQDDEKADDDAKADHSPDEGFQFGEVGGVHERNVFGHGTDAVLRVELENFGTGGFHVALAADEYHRDMIFGPEDILAGFQGDEKTRSLAMDNDAGNGEGMIGEGDGVADFDVACLGADVVGKGFVGSLEGTPGAKDKALTEGIEALVINCKDVDEGLGVREDQCGGGFVDVGEFSNLIAQGFRHDGASKGKKHGRVGRLDKKVGADAVRAPATLPVHA